MGDVIHWARGGQITQPYTCYGSTDDWTHGDDAGWCGRCSLLVVAAYSILFTIDSDGMSQLAKTCQPKQHQ